MNQLHFEIKMSEVRGHDETKYDKNITGSKMPLSGKGYTGQWLTS